MRETLSIIIPVWGEKELVPVLYDRLINVLSTMQVDYQLIYVNDCCPFGSGDELNKLALKDSNVKIINLSRNFGEAVAVKAGIDACNTDWAVIMDCDLQDKPEDIPKLYAKAKEGYDIVWGERKERKDKLTKKFCSYFFYFINNLLSEIKIEKKIGSFSLISNRVLNELKKIDTYTFNYIQMVEYLGFKKAYVPIVKEKREIGSSGYTFFKGATLALKIMISTSNKPLMIPIISSFLMFAFCFLYLAVFLISDLFNTMHTLSDYDLLILVLLFLFGILFLNISIIGIYVGIILKETLKKPRYVIEKPKENQ